MSGNSGLRIPSTSPMLMVPVAPGSSAGRPEPAAAPPPPGRDGTLRWTGSRMTLPATSGSTAGEEHQLELADLQLVAGDELAVLDPLAVQIGAVEGPDVVDGEAVGAAADLGVAARDGDVVQEDVALGVAAGGHRLLVEQEAAAGVRSAPHDQHGGVLAQLLDRRDDLFLDLSFEVLGGEADGGGRVVRGRGQRGPTVRAEVGPFRVLVTALSAEHAALLGLRSWSPLPGSARAGERASFWSVTVEDGSKSGQRRPELEPDNLHDTVILTPRRPGRCRRRRPSAGRPRRRRPARPRPASPARRG